MKYDYSIHDLKYLAVELPVTVKQFKFSGDFVGELADIRRILALPYLPHALRKRLELEEIIASDVQNNYTQSLPEALAEMRETCPVLTESDLRRFVDSGWVDHIRRNGEIIFEEDACANLRGTHEKLLYDMAHPDSPMVPDMRAHLRESIAIQKERGYDAVRYTVELTYRPRETALRPGEVLHIHLPYPAITPEQSEITLLESSHPVRISDAPIRTAYMDAPLKEGECARILFSYINRTEYVCLDPAKISAEQPDFCTGEEYPHIRFTPLLRELAAEVAGSETNPLLKARAAYDWVTRHIMYSYVRPYLGIDNLAEYAVTHGHGDCGIQALLLITLLRIMGIPAQWQSGFDPTLTGIGMHDWTTFYVAPYGWIHADPSFGGSAWRRKDFELNDHYFGNLDPFRLVACTRFQQDFDPPRRFLRYDPYDNQFGEGEYDDAPVREFKSTRKLISAERL